MNEWASRAGRIEHWLSSRIAVVAATARSSRPTRIEEARTSRQSFPLTHSLTHSLTHTHCDSLTPRERAAVQIVCASSASHQQQHQQHHSSITEVCHSTQGQDVKRSVGTSFSSGPSVCWPKLSPHTDAHTHTHSHAVKSGRSGRMREDARVCCCAAVLCCCAELC